MPDIRIIEGGKPSYEAAGELAERVKALVSAKGESDVPPKDRGLGRYCQAGALP
jgi:hypothetical protein